MKVADNGTLAYAVKSSLTSGLVLVAKTQLYALYAKSQIRLHCKPTSALVYSWVAAMITVLERKTQRHWTGRQIVCLFTNQPIMALLNKHLQQRIKEKNNQNALQLHKMSKTAAGVIGDSYQGRTTFPQVQSVFRNMHSFQKATQ